MLDNKETVTTPEEVDAEVTEETEEVEQTEPVESEETEAEESAPAEESTEDSQIDYKAIAEEERQRREKAEKALADKAFKNREDKRETVEQPTEEDDNRPLTRKEFLAMMQEREQEQTKSSQLDEVRKIIAENTTSEDEAEAAYLMYQNRVVPTGDPQADALFAIGGLNVNRSKALTEELKRAAGAKANVSTSPKQHQPDATVTAEPKISSQDAQAIKASGFQWDGKKRLYTKAVGKRTMFYDPKKPAGQKQWIV